MPKELVKYLLTRFGDKLSYGSDHNNCLSPIEQLLLALRFYATGSFQIVIGDLGKVSQPSACRAIQRVSVLIAKLLPEYVSLPKTEEERQEVSKKFYHLSVFPGVYGAVDCTHIRIQSPGGVNAERFHNRKGYFSLIVQTE